MTKIITGVAVTVVAITQLLLAPAAVVAQCCGDCNGDGHVTVDEILRAVNRALNGCQDDGVCQRFPATGQTTCWDTNGSVIACSGTGQDGEIQAGGALAYVDNGDGTISDLNTRLMWEKKSRDGSIHDWSNRYQWAEAFSVFIAGLNSAKFAGHNDWRLPNVNELLSIVNYEIPSPTVSMMFNTNCVASCTVTTCSCTEALDYWSSTTTMYQSFPTYAWTVYFFNGRAGSGSKTDTFYVRAVRGGL